MSTPNRNSNLDPQSEPLDSPNWPADNEPDTVSTPEGDNEYPPDAPLKPSAVEANVKGLQTPRGSSRNACAPIAAPDIE